MSKSRRHNPSRLYRVIPKHVAPEPVDPDWLDDGYAPRNRHIKKQRSTYDDIPFSMYPRYDNQRQADRKSRKR